MAMRDEQILITYLFFRWVLKWVSVLIAAAIPFMILGAAFFHENAEASDIEAVELQYEAKIAASCFYILANGVANEAFTEEERPEVEVSMQFMNWLVVHHSAQLADRGVDYSAKALYRDGVQLLQIYARQAESVGRLEEFFRGRTAECERLVVKYSGEGA